MTAINGSRRSLRLIVSLSSRARQRPAEKLVRGAGWAQSADGAWLADVGAADRGATAPVPLNGPQRVLQSDAAVLRRRPQTCEIGIVARESHERTTPRLSRTEEIADERVSMRYDSVRAGRNRRSFAMTNFAGILSLLFIAAALATSFAPSQPQQQVTLIIPSSE